MLRCVAASLAVFYLLFTTSISLTAFVLIILVETGAWRIVEMIHQVNNGLGRYASASLVISLGSGAYDYTRCCLRYVGADDVEDMVGDLLHLQPGGDGARRSACFSRGSGCAGERTCFSVASAMRCCSRSRGPASIAQNEIDKSVMLSCWPTSAPFGIYAISTRIIDFTSVPIRSFYVLYSRKLIIEGQAQPDRPQPWRRSLDRDRLDGLFAALLAVLSIWPGGHAWPQRRRRSAIVRSSARRARLRWVCSNITPELFFVYQHMTVRAVLATALVG